MQNEQIMKNSNHTFNGQSVDTVLNTKDRCFNGHRVTLLYRNAKTSFLVNGSSKADCVESLRRCFPETANDFSPSVKYFFPI